MELEFKPDIKVPKNTGEISEFIASSILSSWTRVSKENYPKIWFREGHLKKSMGDIFLVEHLVDLCIDESTGKMVVRHCPYWANEEERSPLGEYKGNIRLLWESVQWKPWNREE